LINRDGSDPKHNTRAQKTWIPGEDPALKSLERHLGFTAELGEKEEIKEKKMKGKKS
jgi:hypothetical protein